MGKRGDGYGSEDHFLRYRSSRPEELNAVLLRGLGAADGAFEWVYPSGAKDETEPEGLDFLADRDDVMARWKEYWPQRGRAQTWDGVAKLRRGVEVEWVLIEAKANTVEFVTPPCGASKEGGRDQIEKTLNRLKKRLGVHRHFPWLGTYYQYVNRLAVLHFLNDLAFVPASLLQIYFVGDCSTAENVLDQLLAAPSEARRVTLGLLNSTRQRRVTVILPVFRWICASQFAPECQPFTPSGAWTCGMR